jgi:pimeloyl-ACP methyl ester carboxylesterase
LGKTQVWRTGLSDAAAPALVIFPGFRTASLIWELDGLLAPLRGLYRIYLVDTNGQPTLSEGHTPDIKGPGYGEWAVAVLDALGLGSATVMGASFGGLVCLKLAAQAPGRVVRAFLLNPGCLTGFSLAPRNLFYNLLPIFSPSEKNVRRFLDNAVWHKPSHQLSEKGADLLVEYEVYVLKHWRDGDQDPLFPYQKSIAHARAHLPQLASVKVFPGVAHGIELSAAAIAHVASFRP